MQKFKNTVAGTFALVATFVTVAAATPLRAESVAVPVAYGDLNIESDAGMARLETRIRRAANVACGHADIGNALQVATCRRDAISTAKAKLASVVRTSDVKLAAR